MCDLATDCYTVDENNIINGNKCGDPYNFCVCGGSDGCISNSCTTDSDCSKIGPGSVCNNLTCSSLACQSTSDCPQNMQCTGKTCSSIVCNSRKNCAFGSVCRGSGASKYCQLADPMSLWEILVIIIVTIVLVIVGSYVYKRYKK